MRLVRLKNLATKTVAWPCTLAPLIHYSGQGELARRERVARAGARARGACGAMRAGHADRFLYVDGSHPSRPNALNKALSLRKKMLLMLC